MNLGRWFRTIRDIPPRQLAARVQFEIQSRSLPRLPLPLRQSLAVGNSISTPPLRQGYLQALELPEPLHPIPSPQQTYTFTFLNQPRELQFPITWNSPDYPRLWQFNLHYFDWVREVLTVAYQQGQIEGKNLSQLKHLICDWINANSLCSFDGWHPYTTSLRIVNWTLATRAIPLLAEPDVLTSLWFQVRYLHRHKEYFAGGNHLLENLRALIIGGLNFNHPKAEAIAKIALHQLSQQLALQILPDGGHYERSPMYHLIVLNLVAESVACLRSAGWTMPETISEPLKRMLNFATNIRLSNGAYPLWNDAAYNIANPLDEVVSWVSQLLGQSPNHPTDALCTRLLQAAGVSLMSSRPYEALTTSSHCPDSGYSILRNANGLELAFDYAPPCPDELPPHAHADCLTVDLYCNGQPIIVDTGTSQYAGGEVRSYERSTLAHNTIAIAHQDQSEVWGSFRVGRKAQPFNVRSGTSEGWQWISAAHNGYAKPPLNAVHQRWVGLGSQGIVICDRLETAIATEYTSTLHFAPGLSLVYDPDQDEYCCQLHERQLYIKVLGLDESDRVTWMDADTSQSWYAPEFGRRYPRGCLRIQGLLPPDGKTICTVLMLNSSPKVTWEWSNGKGKVQFENGLFLEPSYDL
ncbi:alginate lyase family protein [Allocoleopsis sp.]|uniref:alginate lyase family protein n=1 Tax=Allocoleopsis sp. TaxID=3088169 RepID=UPI002FD27E0B